MPSSDLPNAWPTSGSSTRDAGTSTLSQNSTCFSVGIAAFLGLLVSVVSRLTLAELPQIPLMLVEVVIASWLLLAPVALYLTFSRE